MGGSLGCCARLLESSADLLRDVVDPVANWLGCSGQSCSANDIVHREFLKLQSELGLACLFISHDTKVVRHVSDHLIVMYLGKAVEMGNPQSICERPLHPYAEALLSAVPKSSRESGDKRIVLQGDLPNLLSSPPGCYFHTRCRYKTDVCVREFPRLTPLDGFGQRSVACHYAGQLQLRGIT